LLLVGVVLAVRLLIIQVVVAEVLVGYLQDMRVLHLALHTL
jgi:hypothetical protein